jgi:hypothetical protein
MLSFVPLRKKCHRIADTEQRKPQIMMSKLKPDKKLEEYRDFFASN